MTLPPLPRLLVEPVVRAALLEDLGRAGDVTTDSVIPVEARFDAVIASRQTGVIAGIDAAVIAFELIDPSLSIVVERRDGTSVGPGDVVMRLNGSARAILTAERVALNIACRMSGVATATAGLVEIARQHGKAHIVCTRKTTPGLRALEKHAVKAGGGSNHRFGLDDAVLIKDNHIAVAGGVAPAIRAAKANAGHMVKIEVEVDTLNQLEEAMAEGVDAVLLDNMTPPVLKEAVSIVGGRALTEASGRVSRETVGPIAASGVDLISVGWITHSAPILDLGLDAASV
ncbi:nicotinate-nucleotide pyrophosphorylase [Ancylobacter novellus DSM 506]|uniref:Probable nicotinate-nucleotide pyrophosphorylase [carboxylating] n=1 Tax=Ancylobacter novellus (strain ATCC 8093 / DSM 506 / JCM 20403 / CCM 1077 / IAM 12100 / NBRC 12443 / NCIMB 10456) TaxID=639283 RepID=D7A405_ANCN5|nr:carboxylating nicotinate-nucleotide diphosphorylase [Ancylobacter novellus]ADH87825.1 nicotinate-nucleotide pyrophosphorylase [Ancylobacter novellus DSM 506]